jgi:hypothetical protein
MIETPADYRSFVFLQGKQNPSQFELCSRVSGVLFLAKASKFVIPCSLFKLQKIVSLQNFKNEF